MLEPTLISNLMKELAASPLSELELTQGEDRLVLRKPVTSTAQVTEVSGTTMPAPTPLATAPTPAPAATPATATTPIEAPLVGVVYLTPEPGAAPYKRVGDHVTAGEVVCIIESMKMMNEIQSPVSGTITAVNVESESLVEFHQTLFSVEED